MKLQELKTFAMSPAAFLLFAAMTCLVSCSKKPSETSRPKNQPAAIAARAPEGRYQWNLRTLVGDYQSVGQTDARWDEPAKNALTLFARLRSGQVHVEEWNKLRRFCAEATLAGASDPLVNYLRVRTHENENASNTAKVYAEMAVALDKSRYAAIRKFYAAAWAARMQTEVNPTNYVAAQPFLRMAVDRLREALQEPGLPQEEADEACQFVLDITPRVTSVKWTWDGLEPILIQHWSDTCLPHLFRAKVFTSYAWEARGGEYAHKVTQDGWTKFREQLEIAANAGETTWKMNPKDKRIPLTMMTVELGQGKGRERFELWFDRAMTLDTNNWDACNQKIYYLHPKWHGSEKEMLDFARECLTSKKWGGTVQLILVDAHISMAGYRENAQTYYRKPEVWRDIQSAFEEFFRRNPEAVGYRHNYALNAYRCEQWGTFLKQVDRFAQDVNYSYFGSKPEFEAMVANARQKVQSAPKSD